ncbi:hypothetical protein GCM10011363_34850 [Marivita lacus]|uniref:Uncharacterized protein n=1 Tax=Marivita lacus TaxID=1323742 RepID=A0ABQ1L3W0_9RHOB|nr:hypothetical protein [Marivita lacus]GGC15402.1 hypothetical protein GCM10011363_34850 [Marivita lacus]
MRPILIAALTLVAQAATADVCDYRPSILAGKAGQAAKSTAGTVASVTTEGIRAVGTYTLENPVSGVSMISTGLSSVTAAGTSLATGAGGAATAAGAIVTAPVTLAVAGLTAVALGGYEGVCHFQVERITDYDEILYIVSNLSANSDPTMFTLIREGSPYVTLRGRDAIATANKVRVASTGIGPFIFDVENLYIADGTLMHRDRGRNTVIGEVGLQVIEVETP